MLDNISIHLYFSHISSNTMSSNASLSSLNNNPKDDKATVDIDAIMDNVSIILFTLTVVLGITGNSLVIWVAGFKLKVENIGLTGPNK